MLQKESVNLLFSFHYTMLGNYGGVESRANFFMSGMASYGPQAKWTYNIVAALR